TNVIDVATCEGDRLVAEATDDELQQSADVVVRFTDKDAGHRHRIDNCRRDWACGMV
ncbi:MAG: hypothetical protein QOE10_2170, partial [Gaiellales bacterium]|nr:hypothetical protein [Gaiellales bacterium]